MKSLSIQEEARLFQGKDKWHTNHIPNTDFKEITMHDGPNGLRIEVNDTLGFPLSKPAIAYPTAALMGCSFDRALLEEYGEILAEECISTGTDILLGPGVNHKRSPSGGRNFEYFSEDPLLSGELAGAYINGVQKHGIGCSLKHFASNNREYGRMINDSVMDERTLHEIYLKQFKIAIEASHPYTIMNAYNKLNGIHCTEHQSLMEEARQWGFDGVFVSDWGAVYDPVASLKAGLNLEMPGGNIGADHLIMNAIAKGILKESTLHRSSEYIRLLALRCGNYTKQPFDRNQHLAFAKKAAEESIVLLKNEEHILPLQKEERILVVGGFAKYPRALGNGSSSVNSDIIDNLYSSLKKYSSNISYVDGYSIKKDEIDERKESLALEKAKENDKVIFVMGLMEEKESEGYDRKNLCLPENQIALLNKMVSINQEIVVVLQSGSVVLLPFEKNVKGIVLTYLAGARSGSATASILYGKTCPSGKLAETWPKREEDVPSYLWFNNDLYETQYRECIFTGYRYYDSFHVKPQYPFGYGLSYTSFQYQSMFIEKEKDHLCIHVTIKNTGEVEGKEIIEIYASLPSSQIVRCDHELIDFIKVSLQPDEEKEIILHTPLKNLEYYDVKQKKYVLEDGLYVISCGRCIDHLSLKQEVHLAGTMQPYSTMLKEMFYLKDGILHVDDASYKTILNHALPKAHQTYPFTPDTTIAELQQKKLGKVIYGIAKKAADRGFVEGMDASMLDETCLRQMLWLSGMNWNTVAFAISYMNAHHFDVLKKLISSIEKK